MYRSRLSLKKKDVSDSSESLAKNEHIAGKHSYFSYVFDSFSSFHALPSFFAHSLFFIESLEQLAPIALYK